MAKPALGAIILGTLLIAGYASGLTQNMDVATIQAWMQQWGMPGVVLFICAFILGNMLSIPGMLFITAAVLAYGPYLGGGIAWTGAFLACISSYVIAKQFKPKPKAVDEDAKPKPKWVQWLFKRLETQPILIIAILRAPMVASPPLNYSLAFSSITTRQYVIGTALGLLLPIIVVCVGISMFDISFFKA